MPTHFIAFFTVIVLYAMDWKLNIHQDSTMFVSWSRKDRFTLSCVNVDQSESVDDVMDWYVCMLVYV